MSGPAQKSPFEFTGGHLCLNFTNTVNNRSGEHPEELLSSYDALVQWASEAGELSPTRAGQLRDLAKETPARADAALRESVRLRDALYQVFLAIVERRQVPDAALETLNRSIRRASEHARLFRAADHFSWEWIDPEEHLESIFWQIVHSAADLLTSDDLVFVGQCASTDCGWLFLDSTKNHRRRWCDMRVCGNRDKARRYYQRTKH